VKKDLTYEKVHRRLKYDPETGIFTYKISCGRCRTSEEAGYRRRDGYIILGINNKLYYAHIIAWLMHYGYFPENQIDHRNRIRHDNWIANLRETSPQCQMRNKSMQSNNSSGVTGVHWYKNNQKWQSRIAVAGSQISLGLFSNFTDAVLARWKAEVKYDFPNCCTTSSSCQWLKDNEPFLWLDLLLSKKE
jgi:hypothetical protein